jgi:DNA invertase Pin-like site-specific DNA recombinase
MTKKSVSIALCRVSTAEQATMGHSLERQEKSVYDAADRLGAPVDRVWSLDQSSRVGKNRNRKDLQQMLEYCRANRHVKYLIVDEVDRFMRDIAYFFHYTVLFDQLEVKIHFASAPELNNEGVMAKLMQALQAGAAESSNEERMKKSLNGLKARVRLGYYPFPIPQGYKRTATAGLFVPDEPRFTLLQEAFRMVRFGKTLAEAVRWLTGEGYLMPNRKVLNANRFREMLRCTYYAGFIQIKKWDFIQEQCLHSKMISRDEYEELQTILDGKKHKVPHKNHNREFPLSNLMECAECGGKLVGFHHRNGKGWSGEKYRCRGCKKKMYRLAHLHTALEDVLQRMQLMEGKKELLIRKLKQVWVEGQSEALGRIRVLESRRELLREEKKKYLDALATYPQLKEDYLERIAESEENLKIIDREIQSAKKVDDDLVEFTTFAIAYIEKLKEGWWQLDYQDMKKCKQILFPAGFSVNYETKVYTPQISPLFRLDGYEKEPFRGSNLGMVEVRGVAPLSTAGNCGVLHAYFRIVPDLEDETLT